MDRPRYTPYIERCVRELEEAREFESDLVLVQLMRIQKLSDGIAQLRADESMENFPNIPRAPLSAYHGAYQEQLDDFLAKMPRPLRSHSRWPTFKVWTLHVRWRLTSVRRVSVVALPHGNA
jgi:hypothetical protein